MAKMTLDELTKQLRAAWGDRLRAVVLYGSAATDEGRAAKASADVLVIVESLNLTQLDAVAATVRAWIDAGNPPPMTMTEEEWRGSADIFPMEYADILERHQVLYGTAPFDGMRVTPQDLRWELENQAMGKLLHLRQGVLAAGGEARRQLELLEVSKSAMLVLFRATLRLHGRTAPADTASVVRDTASLAGFDPEPFLRVVNHVRKDAKLASGDVPSTLAGYVTGIEQLKRHLDQFTSENPSLTT